MGTIRSFDSIMVYAFEFGGPSIVECGVHQAGHAPTVPNAMFDNASHVIVMVTKGSQHYHSCSPWNAKNNNIYGPGVVIACRRSKQTYTTSLIPEWQALDPAQHHDHDVGIQQVSEADSLR